MANIWLCAVTRRLRLLWIVRTNELFSKLILDHFWMASIFCFNICKKWSLRSLLNLLRFSICCLESIILIRLILRCYRTLSNIEVLISLSFPFRSSLWKFSLFTCRISSLKNTHIIQETCISVKAVKQEILLLLKGTINKSSRNSTSSHLSIIQINSIRSILISGNHGNIRHIS